MLPHASYIMLPIPSGCEIDHEVSAPDDGGATERRWMTAGEFSAEPQRRRRNWREFVPCCWRRILVSNRLTSKPSCGGQPETSAWVMPIHPAATDNVGMPANTGDNGACGAGLVDAFAAFQQV